MRVSVALLAEHAIGQDDGKLYVLGGGQDVLLTNSFPFVQPNLALALKLLFPTNECDSPHTVEIRALTQESKEFLPLFVFSIFPRANPEQPRVPVAFPFVRNMRDLRFEGPGRYEFSVAVDREPVASLRLEVILSDHPVETNPALMDALNVSLNEGYKAFVAGDTKRAASIFATLAGEFPTSADVQNNLGFALLADGRIDEALAAFNKAERLGYANTDLLRHNIACCEYLAGDYDHAFERFRGLLAVPFQMNEATLFGLGRASRTAVKLLSPGDFISLASLNAGRSALMAGRVDAAREFSQIAQAGLFTFTDPASQTSFKELLAELDEDVAQGDSTLPRA